MLLKKYLFGAQKRKEKKKESKMISLLSHEGVLYISSFQFLVMIMLMKIKGMNLSCLMIMSHNMIII
jgi:hypothetical protein